MSIGINLLKNLAGISSKSIGKLADIEITEIHHNKNFGVVFSLWDYIFRSLITSKELNQLKFGLNDNEEFIYNHSIITLYIYPFKEIIYLFNQYVNKLSKIKHDILIIKNKRYKI